MSKTRNIFAKYCVKSYKFQSLYILSTKHAAATAGHEIDRHEGDRNGDGRSLSLARALVCIKRGALRDWPMGGAESYSH